MVDRLKIGILLGLGLGLLLGVVAGVAGASYWRASGKARATSDILPGNFIFSERFEQTQAGMLGLRRNARIILLSIDSPGKVAEYRKKWDEQRALQAARLDELEKYASRQMDKDLVKAMQKDLAYYDAGITRVFSLFQDGTIKTPQDANRALDKWVQGERS